MSTAQNMRQRLRGELLLDGVVDTINLAGVHSPVKQHYRSAPEAELINATGEMIRFLVEDGQPSTSHSAGQKFSPENMTRPGSYFCRTALSRDMFGPKYRDAGWLASR